MRRPSDTNPRTAAIDRLVRAGVAAMPDTSSIVEQQLGMVSVALASEQGRVSQATTRTGRRIPRRRFVFVAAMAAFIAIPSLAFAGALPDPVQRVASSVAGVVGLDLPSPSPESSSSRAGAGDAAAGSNRGDSDQADTKDSGASDGSSTEPDDERGHVNGTQPGKPEDGEQRGNRFGQVPEGPDRGKAGQPQGNESRPAKPAAPKPTVPKPAKDPQPATPTPAAPAPVEPAPATPAPGGGNGNGNAGGSDR